MRSPHIPSSLLLLPVLLWLAGTSIADDQPSGPSEGYEPQDINTLTAAIQRSDSFTQMGSQDFPHWNGHAGTFSDGYRPNQYAITVSAFPLYSEDQDAFYFLMSSSVDTLPDGIERF